MAQNHSSWTRELERFFFFDFDANLNVFDVDHIAFVGF